MSFGSSLRWARRASVTPPQANGGEEVDGKAHVAGGVPGEDAVDPPSRHGVLQSLVQLQQAHVLRHFLHHSMTVCELRVNGSRS